MFVSDKPQKLKPVDAADHQVDEHQLGRGLADVGEGLFGVGVDDDLVAILLERAGAGICEGVVLIDNQHVHRQPYRSVERFN